MNPKIFVFSLFRNENPTLKSKYTHNLDKKHNLVVDFADSQSNDPTLYN